jgi:hypothetical protein
LTADGLGAQEICRQRIIDQVFSMETGSGTTGWIRRAFFGLAAIIGPERRAEIYEQECQRYSKEIDPELWRIYTTGTAEEIESLVERSHYPATSEENATD